MEPNRRRFLQAVFASATLGAAGCIGADDEDPGIATELEVTGIPTVDPEDYSNLYETTEIERVNFTPASTVVGEFTARVLEGPVADEFAVLCQLSTMENNFCDNLKNLDTDRIELWDEIPDVITAPEDAPNDPTSCDDRLVGMPIVANVDSFVYNEEETGELNSFSAVFSDREFAGRVALEDNWATSMSKCALYLQQTNQADIQEVANMTPDELEVVADYLIEQKEEGQFRAMWGGYEEAVSLIVGGDVDIMDGWFPMVLDAQNRGIPGARYADPDEGYHRWSIGGYLFDGDFGNQPGVEDAAYDYLNWMLTGAFGATIAVQTGYVTSSPLTLDWAEEHPDQYDVDFIEERIEFVLEDGLRQPGYWTNRTPDHREAYESEWERFKAA